ncbi:MAG: hypothetical protein KA586_06140 [Candidatus Promineofilum sp.]|nr:hypothetical protein [Promineifilum sp.]
MEQRAQSNEPSPWRVLALNGGRVEAGEGYTFSLPSIATDYADAQIDDYGQPGGEFTWRPGTALYLRARFSHDAGELQGTAGFGFWNSPYGDPSHRRLALPQAAWFFFASAPNDLPFAPGMPGRGWFAATLDARSPSAISLIPLAPAVLALNQFAGARRRIWPALRRRLGIYAAAIELPMTQWHNYRVEWRAGSVSFAVDGTTLLVTPHAPRGPLGFVCWIDNQYLVLTPRGRWQAGVVSTPIQWLEIADLRLGRLIDMAADTP